MAWVYLVKASPGEGPIFAEIPLFVGHAQLKNYDVAQSICLYQVSGFVLWLGWWLDASN